jgi:hypothetical protein
MPGLVRRHAWDSERPSASSDEQVRLDEQAAVQDESEEVIQILTLGCGHESVPVDLGADKVGTGTGLLELTGQPHDVLLHRPPDIAWLVAVPQRLHQLRQRHRPVRPQRQHGQHRPLFAGREVKRPPPRRGPAPAQHLKAHHRAPARLRSCLV